MSGVCSGVWVGSDVYSGHTDSKDLREGAGGLGMVQVKTPRASEVGMCGEKFSNPSRGPRTPLVALTQCPSVGNRQTQVPNLALAAEIGGSRPCGLKVSREPGMFCPLLL